MKIAIEKQSPGIVGDFLEGLARTAQRLGCRLTRDVKGERRRPDVLSVVWNGRRHRSAGPTLYCEHAWLPRWEYQVSAGGINADSHIAPFVWDGRPLDEVEEGELEAHMETIRAGGPEAFKYMQTAAAPVDDLPAGFILVPLQMEWDTNIRRHVPPELRKMQSLVDKISRSDPPLPVIYKQHPADVRRGSRQLRLVLPRRQDRVRPHNQGNIHQLLKSGLCRGIVALNSNVVHDGLIWDVPAVVLGKNIWSRNGSGPFLTSLPDDWNHLDSQLSDPSRRAYAHYLMKHQWKLSDVEDEARVADLFAGAWQAHRSEPSAKRLGTGPRRQGPGPKPLINTASQSQPLINVVALDRGWFFEDLKGHFLEAEGSSDARIITSQRPRPEADAWIVIRTQEAAATPDPARTLVQIHDMFDGGLYRHGGKRAGVAACGALCLTHPGQRQILSESGVDLHDKLLMERPIGALEAFTLRESLPDRFTVGWVGRPAVHFGEELKRVDGFVDAVLELGGDFEVVFLGERLEGPCRRLRKAGVNYRYLHRSHNPIETYPGHYSGFDCLVVYSSSEAGPLCLFEALACGVPVIASRVGWAPNLIRDGENGDLVDTIRELTTSLDGIRREREEWFNRRVAIRRSLGGHTLESWVLENIRLAMALARGDERRPGRLDRVAICAMDRLQGGVFDHQPRIRSGEARSPLSVE